MDIETRAQRVVAEELGVEQARVKREARLGEDLHADSLDVVNLSMRLEEEFQISIPEEHDGRLAAGTFGDIVDLIEQLSA